jgi:hypothetical protein
MPKINFSLPILDRKGEPVKAADMTITLEDVAANAVLTNNPKHSGKQKAELFALALKCKGETTLSAEDIVKIKEAIGENYPPLVVGRAWELLDPKA